MIPRLCRYFIPWKTMRDNRPRTDKNHTQISVKNSNKRYFCWNTTWNRRLDLRSLTDELTPRLWRVNSLCISPQGSQCQCTKVHLIKQYRTTNRTTHVYTKRWGEKKKQRKKQLIDRSRSPKRADSFADAESDRRRRERIAQWLNVLVNNAYKIGKP